jgi:hypothetical protein
MVAGNIKVFWNILHQNVTGRTFQVIWSHKSPIITKEKLEIATILN